MSMMSMLPVSGTWSASDSRKSKWSDARGRILSLWRELSTVTQRVSPCFFFFQAEDGIRDVAMTGVQTCALPILEIVVPEEELVRETGTHALDQAIAVERAEDGHLDKGLEDRVVETRRQIVDRLARVPRSLAADLVDDVEHVAVPHGRSVGQEDRAEMTVELAAAREGGGGDDLLGPALESLPDAH